MIDAVSKATPTTLVHEIRLFLGLCNDTDVSSKGSHVSTPLSEMIRNEKSQKLGTLGDCAMQAFEELKLKLMYPFPILAVPSRNGVSTVKKHAYRQKFGPVLQQDKANGSAKHIGYFLSTLTKTE